MSILDLDFKLEAAAEEGAWLTLSHPHTGDDLPIQIKLAGKDSKRFTDAENSDVNKRLAVQKRTGSQPDLSVELVRQRGARLLAAVTLEWKSLDGEGWVPQVCVQGQMLACTASHAKQLYMNQAWVMEQVDEFVGKRSNFGVAAPTDKPEETASVLDASEAVAHVEKN